MTVITAPPTVFREVKAILGESLFWLPETRSMAWCDISAGLLHISPIDGAVDGSDDQLLPLEPPVASFHPARAGGFVVSFGDRVGLVSASGAGAGTLAEVAHRHPGMRLNEGKVDPYGRWITGSMDVTRKDPDGAFYSVEPGGELRVLRGGIGVANGLEWSLDGSRVFFTDTDATTIYTGDYSAAGDITEVAVFHHGSPHDGLTIDLTGHLWSALNGEGLVVRYAPDGSEVERVELPVPNLTSIAFGGPGLSTLFVASAREKLTEEQLEQDPLSGSVFAIQTSVAGRLPSVFGAES
jgi:sugar lactone lactonase YvrE